MGKTFVYTGAVGIKTPRTSVVYKFLFSEESDGVKEPEMREIEVSVSYSNLVESKLLTFSNQTVTSPDERKIKGIAFTDLVNYIETEKKFPSNNQHIVNNIMMTDFELRSEVDSKNKYMVVIEG